MNTLASQPQTQASDFRLLRALCRTMGKTEWAAVPHSGGGQLIRTWACLLGATGHRYPHCPLAFAAKVATGQHLTNGQFCTAGYLLGMKMSLVADIAAAADGDLRTVERKQVRRILLRAAGLPKEPITSTVR